MRATVMIVGACLASWVVGTTVLAPDAGLELALGMALPLAMAAGTNWLVERTVARDPRRLTALMMTSLGAKLVLVGSYVSIVLGLTSVDPIPFVVSFTLYFIALHLTEAFHIRSRSFGYRA